MIDLNELCKTTYAVAERRQKNGGNIRTDTHSMLKHCATEVVEATEAYSDWQNHFDGPCSLELEGDFIGELTDIICCVLIIAGKENIDIEQAITDCIEKNRKRAEGKGDKK